MQELQLLQAPCVAHQVECDMSLSWATEWQQPGQSQEASAIS